MSDGGNGSRRSQSERDRDAQRKRQQRSANKDLTLPAVENPARRAQAEADIFYALATYFPDVFYGAFTDQRREMVEAIVQAATYGGDQAIAAPRGEGKTSIAECVTILLVLRGVLRFPLIVASTGPNAKLILSNLKRQFERNEILAADYPEVCFPIWSLEGAPQRAGSQTVNGERTFLKWAQDHIVLPTVAGSRCSGSVIMTRGLDAAIRGPRVGALRPDIVIIDDPETRESVQSEIQTDNRELIIEQDLAGLGGPGKRLARLMLTTIMKRGSLSDRYTDPTKKASWKGKRLRFVESWPKNAHLWDDYVIQRQTDQQRGDDLARNAHALYLENRAAMDEGAAVGNSERYIRDRCPDGSQIEVSAIQHAYNRIADVGRDNFLTEYQNAPPEDTGPIGTSLSAYRVQTQISGYARKVVPPNVSVITMGIDVRKIALHWVVRGWRSDCTGYTLDYGVTEIAGTVQGSDEGLDVAIMRAIVAHMEGISVEPYMTLDGELRNIDLTLIDSGYRTDAVYAACRQLGGAIKPAKGWGKSAGTIGANFYAVTKTSRDRRPGDGWFLQRQDGGVWLVNMDADRWKAWEHDRWMSDPAKPGCLFNWGEVSGTDGRLSYDERAHHSYARHIVSETEIEEVDRGKLVRRWKSKSDNNHWLDASYMADVAANMLGIKLMPSAVQVASVPGVAPREPQQGWFAREKKKRRGRR